ncbi:hypothetical protein [Streptomyces sp. H27-C3]|uniref:hypothetical protein n=1 Tax=Streptomyces sp. H27-C3 TaxID=3046305 RepID=UPI0024BA4BA3|nr:hypothetical protein [Streptomyces sp. H27-C3]MDJ0466247.1 hypothetical protein [Streptomyces sp. H27-C3]
MATLSVQSLARPSSSRSRALALLSPLCALALATVVSLQVGLAGATANEFGGDGDPGEQHQGGEGDPERRMSPATAETRLIDGVS